MNKIIDKELLLNFLLDAHGTIDVDQLLEFIEIKSKII